MARYFKITEIDRDTFTEATGEDLDCSQLVMPANNHVYVAVDEMDESELAVPLESFDEEVSDS